MAQRTPQTEMSVRDSRLRLTWWPGRWGQSVASVRHSHLRLLVQGLHGAPTPPAPGGFWGEAVGFLAQTRQALVATLHARE